MNDRQTLINNMKANSAGSQIMEFYSKPVELSIDESYDLLEKDVIKNLEYCAAHAMDEVPCLEDPNYFPDNHAKCAGKDKIKGDFYIVQSFKIDKGLKDTAVRSRYYAQTQCPTPTYSQVVYKYNAQKASIEYIWSIPRKDTVDFYCDIFTVEKSALPTNLIPIANECIKFRSGDYDKLAMTLNKEQGRQDKHLSQEKVVSIIDNMIQKKEDLIL